MLTSTKLVILRTLPAIDPLVRSCMARGILGHAVRPRQRALAGAARGRPRWRRRARGRNKRREGHMKLTSPAFAPEGKIPRVHTCEGQDTSPALIFQDVPAGTRSLALVVDDPDAPDPRAPRPVWVHWG